MMAEKPILFSGEMVQAILDGRKTQTRRVITPQPPLDEFGNLDCGRIMGPGIYYPAVVDKCGNMEPGEPVFGAYDDSGEWGAKCPYGRPDDLLYVREKFNAKSLSGKWWHEVPREERPLHNWAYTNPIRPAFAEQPPRWMPSIHMPKGASRITLRVTDVRVERVQDISDSDAKAEGVTKDRPNGWISCESYFMLFQKLWDGINGNRRNKQGDKLPYAWKDNPWVWVVEFELML